ncbi:MAG TPA: PDZ domain-containing protein [Planctomycetes bacterium]|nr:PDZ domain-containing protein [Planctomycetota bacterium]
MQSLGLFRAALLGLALLPHSACTSVPSRPIPDALPEVLTWTRAHQGNAIFFGLEVRENDSDSLEDLFFAPGVRVVRVVDESPAAQVGLKVGDVVLQLAGEEINDPASFKALMAQQTPESNLQLQVQRGDAIFELEARVREAAMTPSPATLVAVAEPARTLARWMRGGGGVVLLASHPKGPLATNGIPDGAIITHLNGTPMRSERALVRYVLAREPGESVTFRWHRASSDSQQTKLELFAPGNRLLEATLPIVIGYLGSADGESSIFYVGDFWLIWLFKYQREGREHHYSLLRFITWSTGEGLLGSQP